MPAAMMQRRRVGFSFLQVSLGRLLAWEMKT